MLLCICNGTSTSDIRNVMAESEAMMNDGGMGEQVRWPLASIRPGQAMTEWLDKRARVPVRLNVCAWLAAVHQILLLQCA
jgi:hypothetical protein